MSEDLQSAFLGKGDILDALLFGPLQIGAKLAKHP